MISKHTIEEIRAASEVVEVVGSYVPLKRAGSAFKGLCPFHKEKTPSFHVNPQRQIFHCFGCGAGGDVFKFVMDIDGVDFITSARLLAQRAGISIQEEAPDGRTDRTEKDVLYKILDALAEFYQRTLKESSHGEAARAYLQSRAIDDELVEKWGVGYAPDRRDMLARWAEKHDHRLEQLEAAGMMARPDDGGRPYERFRNRLMFPIRDELGRTIGFSGRIMDPEAKTAKYVNSPETVLFKKSRILYGLDQARRPMVDQRVALVCEGQIDVIRCHQAGLTHTVAPQGTALTPDHARLLKRYADEVVLLFDADRAGQDAALRSAGECLGAGLASRIAPLPEGADPDSLIQDQGAEAIEALVKQARSVVDFQVDILDKRENLESEAGLMRAVRAILESISNAPTETQREQLLRQAEARLGISVEALRSDLKRSRRERPSPRTEEAPVVPPPVEHPAEEVGLAELLVDDDEAQAFVKHYLPLSDLTDPSCRTIIATMVENFETQSHNLMAALAETDPECQRLAAAIQAAPEKVHGKEYSKSEAVQGYILAIHRKALERQRQDLRRKMDQAAEEERQRLSLECNHLTMDIQALKQGWEKARPILELTVAGPA